MKPDDKADVIDHYEKIGFVTTFCGDGANDCGALKRASVGMSLSDLEASVASPFTSAISKHFYSFFVYCNSLDSIQSVSSIIKEGRCALVTSYGVFKYMVMYSFIQFVTNLIAYWRQTMMSDLQFLFIDLIIVDIFALTATRQVAQFVVCQSNLDSHAGLGHGRSSTQNRHPNGSSRRVQLREYFFNY